MNRMIARKVERMIALTSQYGIQMTQEEAEKLAREDLQSKMFQNMIAIIAIIISLGYSIKFTLESNPIYMRYNFLQFFTKNDGPILVMEIRLLSLFLQFLRCLRKTMEIIVWMLTMSMIYILITV